MVASDKAVSAFDHYVIWRVLLPFSVGPQSKSHSHVPDLNGGMGAILEKATIWAEFPMNVAYKSDDHVTLVCG